VQLPKNSSNHDDLPTKSKFLPAGAGETSFRGGSKAAAILCTKTQSCAALDGSTSAGWSSPGSDDFRLTINECSRDKLKSLERCFLNIHDSKNILFRTWLIVSEQIVRVPFRPVRNKPPVNVIKDLLCDTHSVDHLSKVVTCEMSDILSDDSAARIMYRVKTYRDELSSHLRPVRVGASRPNVLSATLVELTVA